MTRPEPSRPVVLVSGDLNATARVEAASTAAGRPYLVTDLDRLWGLLDSHDPALVIVDLDGTPGAVGALGSLPEGLPLVAYFSHVDIDAGEKAAAAGITALPRGRFWRELPELIAGLGDV